MLDHVKIVTAELFSLPVIVCLRRRWCFRRRCDDGWLLAYTKVVFAASCFEHAGRAGDKGVCPRVVAFSLDDDEVGIDVLGTGHWNDPLV